MPIDVLLVNVGAVLAIVWIVWYFWMSGEVLSAAQLREGLGLP